MLSILSEWLSAEMIYLALMSPYGSWEMQAVLTCTLKLIHLDQCLQAPAARDADRISRFYLQRKEVISMLSLPFKTWFPYSLLAQVTHLWDVARRWRQLKPHQSFPWFFFKEIIKTMHLDQQRESPMWRSGKLK